MKKIPWLFNGPSYRTIIDAALELEKAADMSLEALTALFLAGYTLQPPPAPDYHEMERMASDA